MRNPIDREFNRYLRERGLAQTTIHNYGCLVRRLGREASPLSEPGLEAALGQLQPAQRSPARAAWRHWVEYNATRGISLPTLPRVERGVPALPDVVRLAVQRLRIDKVAYKLMAMLRWDAVQPPIPAFPGKVVLRAEEGLVLLPQDLALELKEWAWPGQKEPVGYLFPEAPGSDLPAGQAMLRALMQTG